MIWNFQRLVQLLIKQVTSTIDGTCFFGNDLVCLINRVINRVRP